MSLLAAALTIITAQSSSLGATSLQHHSPPPTPPLKPLTDPPQNNNQCDSFPASPSSSYCTLPSSSSSSCESGGSDECSSSILSSSSSSRNDHLAVLLPKDLWKPDSRAIHCDNFLCRVKFSLLERRHHCRKCGGVFCQFCSSKTTPLLDTSHLAFMIPPKNIPLKSFESPESPIVPSRVCDDCWGQIHGIPFAPPPPPPPSPVLDAAHRVLPRLRGLSRCQSEPSTTFTSPTRSLPRRRATVTSPGARHSPLSPHATSASESSAPTSPELDAYPLRRSSAICKSTGGGRWEPKLVAPHPGYRIPGGKAPFEEEMEREEREEELRRMNPVVRDGEFQYRVPREPEPLAVTNWDNPSTF